jgi:integrase
LTNKLSARAIEAAKGPAVLPDGGGLLLRVSAAGSKSWVFRYQLKGSRHDMGLGPFPHISLARARELAFECRRQHLAGTDPIGARNEERATAAASIARSRSFQAFAEEFIERKRPAWRSAKHANEWFKTLETYAFPILGALPVGAVDLPLLVRVLEPLWANRPETASRLRGRIEMILDAATVRGFREGPNPAQWKGNLAHVFPTRGKVRPVEHLSAMPMNELPEFMSALSERHGVVARALEFTILTAARSGETLGATWEEIDLKTRVWAVPPVRMKAGREHRVPLCDRALAVLDAMRPLAVSEQGVPLPESPVFPGTRRALRLSPSPLLKLLRRMDRRVAPIHGFRSTFSDWAAERTAFTREVVEMALAHAIENKVEAAYRRGDLFEKRRQMMDAWARFCSEPAKAGEVLPIRAGA